MLYGLTIATTIIGVFKLKGGTKVHYYHKPLVLREVTLMNLSVIQGEYTVFLLLLSLYTD